MTYGEYYYQVKYDMHLKDGVWITNKPKVSIPIKMTKSEAALYYTNKFNKYWESKKNIYQDNT